MLFARTGEKMNVALIFFAFGIIFALHLGMLDDAFGSPRDPKTYVWVNQINEYSNYVHFQPEWNSYPRNLIVDVTTSWQRQVMPGQEEPDMSNHGAGQRQNTLQYVNGKPVVAVQYDYRDCQSQWFHYAKSGLDFLGNQLEQLKAKSIPNSAYSDVLQKQKLKTGFAQFVPVCMSNQNATYKYTVEINDSSIGFDVYFVPSFAQQWSYFLYPEYFQYYDQDGCHASNYQRFTGICDVDNNAGLLIVIPDELSRPLTKIHIKLTEQ